ncbi:MAG: EAL domain-containing response regulator [Roseitalea sp.]|nr:EAL domain-containing response regulator [Roseitalea sp.]MBO6743894.1 EAL domain-containing response regulator [Roseitalea sp.]
MMTNKDRILIVDDEADIRDLFRDVAEECGYEAAEAGNRDQFCAALTDFQPTLVLLDLTMPDGDGVELLREMADRTSQAGVILASGRDKRVLSTSERLGRSLGLTMHPPLQKPIDVVALENALTTCRSVVAEQQVRDAHPARPPLEPVTVVELADAIENGQLEPFFQPKVDLLSGMDFPIIGAEALVRWNHPQRGLVPPDAFIPLAEENGLIGALTQCVLTRTIAHLRQWLDAGIAVPVSVNLSPNQLTDLSLPDHIADLLADAGVSPSLLIIEITEQAAMADIGLATDILTRLRLKGIAVSLDDFGAGYSSLVEIYRLPLSEMKFDRSLIVDIDRDEDARTVVKALVPLARALDLTVCAEGIETAKSAAFLQAIGCHRAQGYHFSKPVPADAFTALLMDQQLGGKTVSAAMS